MNKKLFLTGSFATIGIIILILDGKTALMGAQTGMEMCLKTVIPSLYPFFFLSIIMTSCLSGSSASVLHPLAKVCGIPKGAESILISGFLGGYPVGAQAVSSAYTNGYINKQEADRLLMFCNNAGPAFLFGMVSGLFTEKKTAFLLWAIHIASALFICVVFPRSSNCNTVTMTGKNISISAAMYSAIKVMATVCGWVILFRVFIAFLNRWFFFLLPSTLQVVIIGILELSNGCYALSQISNPELRFIICSGILSLGGLCVTMQTQSVIEGLSIKHYLVGKLFQTCFSLLLSISLVHKIWFPVICLIVFTVILRKKEKISRNPTLAGV